MDRLNELYFKWLVEKVCDDSEIDEYSILLHELYTHAFVWVHDLDENLAVYGLNMRDEFLEESPTGRRMIKNSDFVLDECSILEVLVSLSVRIETNIMSNDTFGDREAIWFWKILGYLGLDRMENGRFDEYKFEEIIEKTINSGKISRKKCVNSETIWIQIMKNLTVYAMRDGEIW